MRRLGVIVVSVALVGWLASSAAADSGEHHGPSTLPVPVELHKSWMQWALGGPTAPLLQDDMCGEMVGHVFYANVVVGAAATRRLDCEIPKGVPILVTPGGYVAWEPTDGTSDQQIRATMLTALENLVAASVLVKLDGEELDHGALVAPDPYDLKLEPGNTIQAVDPNVTGDSTRIAEGFYFTLIRGLGKGTHTIVANDRFRGNSAGVGAGRFRTIFTFHAH